MPRYKGDPRWIIARFASQCRCGKPIKAGEHAFYYPTTKTLLCDSEDCGKKASAEFDAAAQDEGMMSGEGW